MTNIEAIKYVDEKMCFGRGTWTENHRPVIDEYWEAGTLAMVALIRQSMIVHCKDCKHRGDYHCPMFTEECVEYDDDGYLEHDYITHDNTIDDGFCNWGEKDPLPLIKP